jgi:CBS domain-containing protein
MKVKDCCRREVVTIAPGADLIDAARRMREGHVGFLIVVQQRGEETVPVGVITDRDLVLEALAKDVIASEVRVADAMSADPLSAGENDELEGLLHRMRAMGVRRAPVVSATGALTGVISIDDIIDIVSGLLSDVSGSIRNEQRIERQLRK